MTIDTSSLKKRPLGTNFVAMYDLLSQLETDTQTIGTPLSLAVSIVGLDDIIDNISVQNQCAMVKGVPLKISLCNQFFLDHGSLARGWVFDALLIDGTGTFPTSQETGNSLYTVINGTSFRILRDANNNKFIDTVEATQTPVVTSVTTLYGFPMALGQYHELLIRDSGYSWDDVNLKEDGTKDVLQIFLGDVPITVARVNNNYHLVLVATWKISGPSTLVVSDQTQSLNYNTTSTSFNISFIGSPKPWTATSSSPGVSLNPSSGTGAETVEVTLTANDDPDIIKTSTITVTSENTEESPQTVTLNQGVAPMPTTFTWQASGQTTYSTPLSYKVSRNIVLQHQLSVKLNGVDVPGSPFTAYYSNPEGSFGFASGLDASKTYVFEIYRTVPGPIYCNDMYGMVWVGEMPNFRLLATSPYTTFIDSPASNGLPNTYRKGTLRFLYSLSYFNVSSLSFTQSAIDEILRDLAINADNRNNGITCSVNLTGTGNVAPSSDGLAIQQHLVDVHNWSVTVKT